MSWSARDAAEQYLKRGWMPVPVAFRAKNPIANAWQKLRLNASEIGTHFGRQRRNIGIILGEPSGWLVDVDLDCEEAVALATQFLPPTPLRFGRPGRPLSHWLYIAADARSETFREPVQTSAGGESDKKKEQMLVEIRSTGLQTVCPPSTHESGEPIAFESWPEDPTVIEAEVLRRQVVLLSIAVLAVRGGMPVGQACELARAAPTGLERLAPMNAARIRTWMHIAEPGLATVRKPAAGAIGSSQSLQEAVDRYNAENRQDWPKSHGTCPGCDEPGCFGRLADSELRWVCFNTCHVEPGLEGNGCFTGDVLDLDAHAAGRSRVEHLRASGYLAGSSRQGVAPHSEKEHCNVSPTVSNDAWYNEDAARGVEELLITPQVPACDAAMQAGVASIAPMSGRFREQDIPRLIELAHDALRVIILTDTGMNRAEETDATGMAAALWAEKIEVCIAQIPRPDGVDRFDVAGLIETQGADALRKVLAAAVPYPEHLVAAIPKDAPKSELGKLLAPVFAALAGCSKLRADAVLDLIQAKFGVRRRALLEPMKVAAKNGGTFKENSTSISGVPMINLAGRQLREIVSEARTILVQANERRIKVASMSALENDAAPLFARGNALVRLERPIDGAPQLAEVTDVAIYGVLAREADWVRLSEEGCTAALPPKDVSRDLIVYPPPGIPAVDSVITTPVFGRSGRILMAQGLHESDRLWLDSGATLDIGTVPENPTPEQIAAARSLFIDDLLVDFPFAAPSDRAHAVALALLAFVRRMVDGCTPLHLVEAPAVGTGKGLLCDLVSIVATGEVCDCRTLPDDDDEIRKMLTAELSRARPLVLLDNANEKLTVSAPALCSVLTAEVHTDRLLGRSEMLRLPNRAVWMLTGNNPKLSKDMARRSIRIRIDSKVDRAWTRASFRHDPIRTWAKEHRNELVHAALVLVQAWVAAGRPLSKQRLGSFEHWAGVMGGILEVAGIGAFLGNQNELYENADVEGQAWREFTQAWWDEYGSGTAHVADLVGLCEKHDLMVQTRGDGAARSQQSRLGRALQSARDRVFGDLQIVVAELDRKKRTLYALQQMLDGRVPATAATAGPGPLDGRDLGEIDPWQ